LLLQGHRRLPVDYAQQRHFLLEGWRLGALLAVGSESTWPRLTCAPTMMSCATAARLECAGCWPPPTP
jgi:hypothetical protein